MVRTVVMMVVFKESMREVEGSCDRRGVSFVDSSADVEQIKTTVYI